MLLIAGFLILIKEFMKSKVVSRFLGFVFTSTGIIFLLLLFLNFIPQPSIQDFYIKPVLSASNQLTKDQPIKNSTKSEIPVRLKIPRIGVNVNLEQVGLTPQGAVGVPKSQLNAAWFNLWPRPGEIGSAVIVGHYGVFKNGITTVFNNLSKLKIGDKIYVVDKAGTTTTFVVRKFQIYNSNEVATDVFSSSDGKSHLNLITCNGIWDKASKSYSKRLVIFSDLLP